MKRRVPSYIQALFKLGPKLLTEKKRGRPNLEDKSRPQLNCLNWWAHYRQKLIVNNPLSGWPVFLKNIGVLENFWTTISHQTFLVWLIVKIFFLKKINFRKINTRKNIFKIEILNLEVQLYAEKVYKKHPATSAKERLP